MARGLGISPSYLNHLERNQRPVTAALLFKLADHYEVDVRTFAADGGGAKTRADALAEIFSDALLSDLGVPRYELAELANNAPSVADAIARLYAALKEAGRNPEIASAGDARALVTPENWVRDYIQQHRNHYPALEEAAETLGGALSDPLSMSEPMRRRLKEMGISARSCRRPSSETVSQLYDADRPVPDLVPASARRTAPSRSPTSWRWSSSRRCSTGWWPRGRRRTGGACGRST